MSEGKKYFSEEEIPVILSVKEVSNILGISYSYAYNLFCAKDFPSISFGKRKVIRKESLLRWLQDKETEEKQKWPN